MNSNKLTDGKALSLEKTIINLASCKLAKAQKNMLIYISKSPCETSITNYLKKLSRTIGCAESTLWFGLRALKYYGFVDFVDLEKKSQKVIVTTIGELVVREIGKNENQ